MRWYDKRNKKISNTINCKTSTLSNQEIEEIYLNNFCLRNENGNLTVEEAKEWFNQCAKENMIMRRLEYDRNNTKR